MSNGQTIFPWDETPNSDVLPNGDYVCTIKTLDDTVSGSQKRMFVAHFEVKEPQELAGMMYTENFVTSTDEQPTAILPSQFGTRRLKRMLMAAQVPGSNDPAVLCATAKGALLGISIVKYVETKNEEYKGSERNRASAFWKIGEKQPQVAMEGAAVKGIPTKPIAAAPSAPLGKPPTAMPHVQPALASQPPQPAAPIASQPLPKPAAPTPAQAPLTVACPIAGCGQLVPVRELAAHIAAHGEV